MPGANPLKKRHLHGGRIQSCRGIRLIHRINSAFFRNDIGDQRRAIPSCRSTLRIASILSVSRSRMMRTPFALISRNRPENSTLAAVPVATVMERLEDIARLPAMEEAELSRAIGAVAAQAPPEANGRCSRYHSRPVRSGQSPPSLQRLFSRSRRWRLNSLGPVDLVLPSQAAVCLSVRRQLRCWLKPGRSLRLQRKIEAIPTNHWRHCRNPPGTKRLPSRHFLNHY